jgi:hypothetical protein
MKFVRRPSQRNEYKKHDTLEIKAWDKQKNVTGLNLLMGSQFSLHIVPVVFDFLTFHDIFVFIIP